MRLRTLILASGILLSCPSLLLAMSQVEKTKILTSEWKAAQNPKVELSQEKEPFKEHFLGRVISTGGIFRPDSGNLYESLCPADRSSRGSPFGNHNTGPGYRS